MRHIYHEKLAKPEKALRECKGRWGCVNRLHCLKSQTHNNLQHHNIWLKSNSTIFKKFHELIIFVFHVWAMKPVFILHLPVTFTVWLAITHTQSVALTCPLNINSCKLRFKSSLEHKQTVPGFVIITFGFSLFYLPLLLNYLWLQGPRPITAVSRPGQWTPG